MPTIRNNAIVTADSEEPIGYTPTAIRDAYGIPEDGGSDQTIAIIASGDDPNAEADLIAYRSHYGLPPCTASNGCFQKRNEFGATNNFPPASVGSALETSIDLQMASVACQECKLLLVEGDLFKSVNTAVSLGATEISISLGVHEASGAPKRNKYFDHPGIPITASSGDWGYRNFKTSGNHPNYPASAPNVIAVGGTELTPAPNTSRGWIDNVWGSTGGGCSEWIVRPKWQKVIACDNRMTNDVSIVAANIPVYASYEQSTKWHTVEGTSIGAPLIAGIYAHASQVVRDKPAEALYNDLLGGYGSIYDVGPSDTLNNTNYEGYTCSPVYLCTAVAGSDGHPLEGYDGPTGVGVPQGPPVSAEWEQLETEGVEGPAPEVTYEVEGIDCVSPDECIAVGETSNPFPFSAEWDGAEWEYLAIPFFEEEEVVGGLADVACISVNRSIAVGLGRKYGEYEKAFAMWWDGEEWTSDESFPLFSPSDPPSSVSCASPNRCMVIGSDDEQPYSAYWNGSSWSMPSVPGTENPFDGAEPLGVSCSKEEVENKEKEPEELCVAAGWYYPEGGSFFEAFVEVWDGSEWSIDTSLTSPGVESYLYDIDCPSHRSCMAVGFSTESEEYEEYLPLSLHWDGSQWVAGVPALPKPAPSGETAEEREEEREAEEEGEAIGVSCATATSCIAVGANYGSQVVIAGWNGTSWGAQEHPDVDAPGFATLEDVSCVAVDACHVIGQDWTGIYLNPILFAQLGEDPAPYMGPGTYALPEDPHKTTLKATINPNGSATTYEFEYGATPEYGSKAPASPESIGSGTSPVEVSQKIEGLEPETTYHFRLVATSESGTVEGEDQTFTTPSWKVLSTPNPEGASDSNLNDVSCEPSANVCTAVGKSTKSGGDSPLAQRWNGTSWSSQSPAKKSGTLPTRLFGVDCPSESRCMAVGNYQSSEGPVTVAELWNENKWNVHSTLVPSEATSSELVAVGCNSTANCTAVGSALIGGVKKAIAERWTSPNWALSSIPIPEGAKSSQLDGVDCLWSNFCAAVGRYTTSGGSVKSLVMFWNGTEWTLQTVTDPEGAVQSTLHDVACTPTPNRCTAVGGWKDSEGEQFTLAYRFNGVTTWTLQSTADPSESTESVLQDVSCASETTCTAAGNSVIGGSTESLAERWNGTSWSIQGTSTLTGATFSSLFGVSCRGTTCVGVGWSTDGSGVDTTLAENRE